MRWEPVDTQVHQLDMFPEFPRGKREEAKLRWARVAEIYARVANGAQRSETRVHVSGTYRQSSYWDWRASGGYGRG